MKRYMKWQWILVGLAIVFPPLALAAGHYGLSGLALVQGPSPQGEVGAQAVMAGTGFTYQGLLLHDGSPFTETCSMKFWLFDGTGTVQVADPLTFDVPVTNGLFTAGLDFGNGVFNGEARSLRIQVTCPIGGYANLGLQPLTPSPYALALPGLWTQQNATSPNLIGGYSGNSVAAGMVGATIGGGGSSAHLNQVTANYGAVGGGEGNQASGSWSTVGGGSHNAASSLDTVGGGGNNVAQGGSATVAGGGGNEATASYATVGGGSNNRAEGAYTTIGGGDGNVAEGGVIEGHATVGGGRGNEASGFYATVPGGYWNEASGKAGFAAGYKAHANHNGCFVWADDSSEGTDLNCPTDNAFVVRASGGVTMYTNAGTSTGARLPAGGGSWSALSDRTFKANVVAVDGSDVLARLAQVPVSTWNYSSQEPSIRHMGPMAQDFYAAFGLGEDERYISTIDADGVALAAIQALAAENAALRARLDALEARLAALEAGGGQ